MFEKIIVSVPVIVVTAFLSGCMDSTQPSTQTPGVSSKDNVLAVSIALSQSVADSLSVAEIKISGTDMDTITRQWNVAGAEVYNVVDGVPSGYSRNIDINLVDKHNHRAYYGTTHADVLSDARTNASLKLKCDKDTTTLNGNCRHEKERPVFMADSSTVFLADFNSNLTDLVTHTVGTLSSGSFVPALSWDGLKFDLTSHTKALYKFSRTPQLDISTGTMEALVYVDSLRPDYNHIIDKSWLYGITVAPDGNLAVHFGGPHSAAWWFTTVPLPLKAWSYVCGSFDGTTLRLYLNGALVASTPYDGFHGDTSYDLGIGNATASTNDVRFAGIIDEIRISKSVRSPQEIIANWSTIHKKIEAWH